ncbi:MAG: SDR family oxidoreductase [Deltaproteobacteria bacterium]
MERDGVAITGISGNLGRALAKRLHGRERIVGIDRRPFRGKPKDLEMHEVDIRRNKAEAVFQKGRIKVLIHMGIMHDPRMSAEDHHSFNVVGTTRVLDWCVRYGIKKVVVLSSANVYGPSPDNSNFLTEDAPLMASQRYSDVRDLVAVDMFAQSFFYRHPKVETVVVRPVHIVGPHIKNAPSNYLRLPRPWTLLGFDPMLQLMHVEDACEALVAAMAPGVRGVYNVVGPGEVPLSLALRELRRDPIPVPHFLARPLLAQLFKLHVAGFPPPELDHLQWGCTVDGSRFAKETGFKARHPMRETLHSIVQE